MDCRIELIGKIFLINLKIIRNYTKFIFGFCTGEKKVLYPGYKVKDHVDLAGRLVSLKPLNQWLRLNEIGQPLNG